MSTSEAISPGSASLWNLKPHFHPLLWGPYDVIYPETSQRWNLPDPTTTMPQRGQDVIRSLVDGRVGIVRQAPGRDYFGCKRQDRTTANNLIRLFRHDDHRDPAIPAGFELDPCGIIFRQQNPYRQGSGSRGGGGGGSGGRRSGGGGTTAPRTTTPKTSTPKTTTPKTTGTGWGLQ
ncbi:hypothetical protein P152DRAFT_155940 [Eremomyces bilateralis CBS 781.70]|uniref:Uncharacterized protein n=1 Tax=Eremomyces bilateralis CBS 781.70 TaxID=1392243 RepID=A0A6G1FUT2_9PEZI|nr:uncharacterized protein P152DRAFT_155940 [Eremomyces bilateralis CBS 781.70]KAF1809655.1 hypothetical protein P152DRAFT_155940 [Eremomyces bilateralis CBS 781.70]